MLALSPVVTVVMQVMAEMFVAAFVSLRCLLQCVLTSLVQSLVINHINVIIFVFFISLSKCLDWLIRVQLRIGQDLADELV
jgi:hypothetical protein